MSIDFTGAARPLFVRRARRTDAWDTASADIQRRLLRRLLRRAAGTETGRRYGFDSLARLRPELIPAEYARRVPPSGYEEIRDDVMRMIRGEADVLWPGVCRNYAQSSGTSGGRSKYIPVTDESLRHNHYPGAADTVAHYLRMVPSSRLFAGKGLILGGSFSNSLGITGSRVKVGDLSATLIDRTPWPASAFRVPSKRIALMPDWESKLPALARAALRYDITNLSGVPSWFMTLLKEVLRLSGADNLSEVWPHLEVFFHGGISFAPYREEYARITDRSRMSFLETYNASEGFFATQNDFADRSMLLIIDSGVYYEFEDAGGRIVPLWELTEGDTYELIITAANGLWRYRLGDTVTVHGVAPVKITIAGRTKSFINAFGEELMEHNAEAAITAVCRLTGASVRNYTAGPVFAGGGRRGRHEWIIEWEREPRDTHEFATLLDRELQRVNSDYEAKRAHSIFLDPPTIVTARRGLFDDWLRSHGSHKLGGQRKVPRLSNNRDILEQLAALDSR